MGVPISRVTVEHALDSAKAVSARLAGVCRKMSVITGAQTDGTGYVKLVVIECERVPAPEKLLDRLRTEPSFQAVWRERWGQEFAAFRWRGVLIHIVDAGHGGQADAGTEQKAG